MKRLVLIGASTGGIPVLLRLFEGMPVLDCRIVIVRHMPAFINESTARMLDRITAMVTRLARSGDRLESGQILLAPGGQNLRLVGNQSFQLDPPPPEEILTPRVDVTFSSVRAESGLEGLGILLTGMGSDGVAGLGRLRSLGMETIAQDEASSAVWGMPGRAVAAGVVQRILSPESIRRLLLHRYAPATHPASRGDEPAVFPTH